MQDQRIVVERILLPSGEMSGPAQITIRGSKIIDVTTPCPAGALDKASLTFAGCTALPGLIDAHVHLCFDPRTRDVTGACQSLADGDLLQLMGRFAAGAAAAGVTTLRDCGDRNFLSVALRSHLEQRPGPTVVCCGPPLTVDGGHCAFLGGSVPSNVQPAELVDTWQDKGVDQIKVMVSGGILTPESSPMDLQFTVTQLKELVERAHGVGLPVAAHAHSTAAVTAAVAAGVDTIEHASFQTSDAFSHAVSGSQVDALAESGIVVSPTLCARPGVEQSAQRLRWRQELVARLHQAGVRLAAGTDAGVLQGLGHDSLPYALQTFTDSGLSAREALLAGTVNAARAVGKANSKGALAPGWDADVLIVKGNPLQDITALRHIAAVFARGRRLAPLSVSDRAPL
ncbi:amidohydrolase family protein [Streptomyces sp. NPDC086783]|uniref:amidohydrolase family protein n=1 Tax=Streptomyces sp. NPDC086783 TaxID=3365758 RepID=UPI0038124184